MTDPLALDLMPKPDSPSGAVGVFATAIVGVTLEPCCEALL